MSGKDLPICVVGVGASTAIGLTAPSTAAAVRAAIAGFAEHPEMVDQEGEPMIVAKSPMLDAEITGIERFLELALPAAQEALAPLAGLTREKLPIPMVIGLPAQRPGLPGTLGQRIAERFKDTSTKHWTVADVEALATGHSAGLMALENGMRRIQNGVTEFCLIGGIDSYLEPTTLEWLEKCDQLHGAGPHNNAWGFIPGEASGFGVPVSARDSRTPWTPSPSAGAGRGHSPGEKLD